MSEALRTALVSRATVADGVIDLTFAMVSPPRLDFQAGQFVTLAVGKDARGQDVRRSYSIASSPRKPSTLRFLLRLMPGGIGSDFFAGLDIGAEVAMTGPHGFFVLEAHHLGDVVFGATGTGIAPVLPMLEELAGRREKPGRKLEIYWGIRNESDLFVLDDVIAACATAGARLHVHVSRPSSTWTGGTGRINGPILESLPALDAPTFYLVGNGAMITELKRALVSRGVDRKKQIRTESFFD